MGEVFLSSQNQLVIFFPYVFGTDVTLLFLIQWIEFIVEGICGNGKRTHVSFYVMDTIVR